MISSLNGSSTLNYSTFAIRTSPIDIIRLVSEIKTDSNLELSIRNMFINCIFSCDKRVVGSGIICAMLLSIDDIEIDSNFFFRCQEKHLEKALASYLDDHSYSYKLALEAFRVAGPGSHVFFKESPNKDFSVMSVKGKIIVAKTHELFDHKISEINNPRILFVDGIIESIGEIDCLLQSIASEKIPACIFSRGFSADVVKTMSHNYSNGSLRVVPIVYQSGAEDDASGLCRDLDIPCYEPRSSNDIRKATVKDLKLVQMVSVRGSTVSISSKSGEDFQVQISYPKRMKKVSGILFDRVKFGKLLMEAVARGGLSKICSEQESINSFFTGKLCYEHAAASFKSFEKSLEDLHRVIAV